MGCCGTHRGLNAANFNPKRYKAGTARYQKIHETEAIGYDESRHPDRNWNGDLFRYICFVAIHRYWHFESFIMLCIFANIVTLAMDNPSAPPTDGTNNILQVCKPPPLFSGHFVNTVANCQTPNPNASPINVTPLFLLRPAPGSAPPPHAVHGNGVFRGVLVGRYHAGHFGWNLAP